MYKYKVVECGVINKLVIIGWVREKGNGEEVEVAKAEAYTNSGVYSGDWLNNNEREDILKGVTSRTIIDDRRKPRRKMENVRDFLNNAICIRCISDREDLRRSGIFFNKDYYIRAGSCEYNTVAKENTAIVYRIDYGEMIVKIGKFSMNDFMDKQSILGLHSLEEYIDTDISFSLPEIITWCENNSQSNLAIGVKELVEENMNSKSYKAGAEYKIVSASFKDALVNNSIKKYIRTVGLELRATS